MRRDVRRLAEMGGQIVVERHDELRRFNEWFADRNPVTLVCSVSGIGGIGKTTFLEQIAERALRHGIQVARVDGYLGFGNVSELLSYLCDQLGLTNAHGTDLVLPEALSRLSGWLSERKTVLLFDHFEEMVSLESFIRTELVPHLPANGVMFVVASRAGLSMGWRTDPALVTRTLMVRLDNLSWQQSMEYVERAGIKEVGVQQRISREASGYPLALALAVQSALQESRTGQAVEVSVHEISANLFREAASELNALVEGLIFLRTGTQDVLSDVTQREVVAEDFRALGRLSYVRVTAKGLAVHDVARANLLRDLKGRHPQRFNVLFQRTVDVLARRIEGVSGSDLYDMTHNLLLLFMVSKPDFAYPDSWSPLQVSARELPRCEPVIESDVDDLHRLVDIGILGGIGASGLQYHHELLDLLIRHFPESVRVVRHHDGRAAAFTTLLPLYQESLSVLPGFTVEVLSERLGQGLPQYMSLAETDTVLSLMTCVPKESQEFTFSELLLAVTLTGYSELAQGKRCLLFSSDPGVKEYHLQLGYEYLTPRGPNPLPVDVCSVDFRSKSMGKWLASLLLGVRVEAFHQTRDISKDALRDGLKYFQSPTLLQQSQLAKALGLSAEEVQRMLQLALTETTPRKPLTAISQNILRLSYLEGKSVVAVAGHLHIGRTTYYRYLEKALSELMKVIQTERDDAL